VAKTILIADDDQYIRVLVKGSLKGEEYRIVEAADGVEAWEQIRRERPDLVLLDVQMPGQTGLEIARAVREDPDLASTVIVMLTGKTEGEDILAGHRAGVDLYFMKPFAPPELQTIVREALRLRP
jgi:DNA-binding response OmpR family regulator